LSSPETPAPVSRYLHTQRQHTPEKWANTRGSDPLFQHLLIIPLIRIAADQVEKLLKEVGVQVNKEDLATMIKALSGKKLHDLVRDGTKKLASVPSGAVASTGKNHSPSLCVVVLTFVNLLLRRCPGCPRCRCPQEGGEAQGRGSCRCRHGWTLRRRLLSMKPLLSVSLLRGEVTKKTTKDQGGVAIRLLNLIFLLFSKYFIHNQ